MNKIPYEQMCEIDQIRKEIDKVYRVPFYFIGDRFADDTPLPLIDIYETENEFIVSCDLPTLQHKDDVTLHIQDDRLMLCGVFLDACDNRKKVNFYRAIALPVNVSSTHIRAVYQSGLLKIHISKKDHNPSSQPIAIDFLN